MRRLEIQEMEMIQAGWHWRCWLGAGLLAIGVATGIGLLAGVAVVAVAEVAGGVAFLNSKSCD